MGPDGQVRHTGRHRLRAGQHDQRAVELHLPLARLRHLLHRRHRAAGGQRARRRRAGAGPVDGHAEQRQLFLAARADPKAGAEGPRRHFHSGQQHDAAAKPDRPLRPPLRGVRLPRFLHVRHGLQQVLTRKKNDRKRSISVSQLKRRPNGLFTITSHIFALKKYYFRTNSAGETLIGTLGRIQRNHKRSTKNLKMKGIYSYVFKLKSFFCSFKGFF